MWNASSTEILASQTCWTADGSNNCGRSLGGKQFDNPLLQFLTNEEIEALQERPEIINQLQINEDDDIINIIVTMVTRGLL